MAMRNLLLITFLFITSIASAQYRYTPYTDARDSGMSRKEAKPLKEVEKTLKRVTVYKPDMSHCLDVDAFWSDLRQQTKEYSKYIKKITKGNKFAVKTRNALYENQSAFESSDVAILVHYLSETTDSVLQQIFKYPISSYNPALVNYFSGSTDPVHAFSVLLDIDDADMNVQVWPCGNIDITYGLLTLLDSDEIIGVIAHEVAHYKLKHIELGYYTQAKRKRSNDTWAAIGAGFAAVAVGVMAYGVAADVGVQMDYDVINPLLELGLSVEQATAANATKYHAFISRWHEVEADIAAMRFMQWSGIAPAKYIGMLEKLKDSKYDAINYVVSEDSQSPKNTPPSMEHRIAVLKSILNVL